MTPPRDVQDYEAQAREVVAEWNGRGGMGLERLIETALRAAGRRAQGRTAMLAAGMVRGLTAPTRGEISELARQIQDLAPAPESPPALLTPDEAEAVAQGGFATELKPLGAGHSDAEPQPEPPRWRIGRHYGIHVYCGDTPIATFHSVADAQAAVCAYNASLDAPARYVVPVARLADAEKRIAELEAALAKAHDAIRWACGDEPLKDGRWFNCRAFGYEDNAAPRYWWRSILRLYSGLPDDPAPSKEPPP